MLHGFGFKLVPKSHKKRFYTSVRYMETREKSKEVNVLWEDV